MISFINIVAKPISNVLLIIGAVTFLALVIVMLREKENRRTMLIISSIWFIGLIALVCFHWIILGEGASKSFKYCITLICILLSMNGLIVVGSLILLPIVSLIMMNKEIMIGYLTCDPELRYLPNNIAVVEFELAYYKEYKSQDGSARMPYFMYCQAFGKLAENINKCCSEDDLLLVKGRQKSSAWIMPDGSKSGKGGKPHIKVKKFLLFDLSITATGANENFIKCIEPNASPIIRVD